MTAQVVHLDHYRPHYTGRVLCENCDHVYFGAWPCHLKKQNIECCQCDKIGDIVILELIGRVDSIKE